MTIQLKRGSTFDGFAAAPGILALLAAAAVTELVVLRLFTRTAVHIPALHSLQGPYEIVSAGGQYAYFVSLGLILPATLRLVFELYRTRSRSRFLASFGLLVFGVSWAFGWSLARNLAILDFGTLVGVAALASAAALADLRGRSVVPLVLFAVAFAAAGLYTALPALGSTRTSMPQPGWLLSTTEFAGLAFAVSTPLLAQRPRQRSTHWLAAGAGGLILLTFLGNGSTSRFLLLWNVGLSGIVPGFVYALAGAALVYAVVALWRQGSGLAASGLLLLVAGGIGLHSTYQSSLVVVGLTALLVGIESDRRAAPGPHMRKEPVEATTSSTWHRPRHA
jgi:hypothetical protein